MDADPAAAHAPIVIETELGPRDWDALQHYLYRRVSEQKKDSHGRLAVALVAIVAAALATYAMLEHRWLTNPFGMVAGVLIGAVAVAMITRLRMQRFAPAPDSLIYRRTRVTFDANAITATSDGRSSVTDWQSIGQVDETAEHIFLPIDYLTAYVIPKNQLGALSAADVLAQLRQWHGEATRSATRAAASPLDADPQIADVGAAAPAPATAEAGAAEAEAAAADTRPLDAQAPVAQPPILHTSGSRSHGWPRHTSYGPVPATSPVRIGLLAGLKSNLIAGARVFFHRPVATSSFESTFGQVVALFALNVVLLLAFDWLLAGGPSAEFLPYNFYYWFAYFLYGVWACSLAARTMGPQADTRSAMVACLSVAPLFIVALAAALWIFLDRVNPVLVTCFISTFIALMGLRALQAVHGFLRVSTFAVVVLAALGIGVAREYLYLDPQLWMAQETTDELEAARPDYRETESILYAEPARITAAAEALEPQRPGVTDVYYIGFAGDGSQRVFRREALFGQKVFGMRMDSATRSLVLINDHTDRETHPLATLSGLRHSLNLIGKQMNTDEDVLVLLLTSHGSRERGLSVDTGVTLWGDDVSPQELRSALDASGIKWRIVLVSACYAGVFIEPLKSENTFVMTAADPEHNSFGCADDRHLTYFGEAFLEDAMLEAASLEQAFELAKLSISAREQAEKKTPSNPQIFVGESMRQKLVELPLQASQ